MQQLLGEVFEELGGIDFVTDWAEENPGDFMRIMMAANPPPIAGPGVSGGAVHLHMHPALAQPGPLDGTGRLDGTQTKVVSEQ